MHLSTDQLIFWQHGFLKLNGTIVYTWGSDACARAWSEI